MIWRRAAPMIFMSGQMAASCCFFLQLSFAAFPLTNENDWQLGQKARRLWLQQNS
jgi:arginine exporter protein ArgO